MALSSRAESEASTPTPRGVADPPIDSQVNFPPPQGVPAGTVRVIIALNSLTFPHYGDYAIQSALDGHDVASLRLAVVPPPVTSA